eukprot:TRINITY_DN1136_c0_g1_i1.p1 TRINITY_DN1136_c0_g1~~TRINITY_DN1136_c0_g1_i1.p1  ORF type:complete len:305 (+),score=46.48 TRINITY_DN1136_c0_g1_i1:54-968(+)
MTTNIPPIRVNIVNHRTKTFLHCPNDNDVKVYSTDATNDSNKWIFQKQGTNNYWIRNVRTWKQLHCNAKDNVVVWDNAPGSNNWSLAVALPEDRYGKNCYTITNQKTGKQLHCKSDDDVVVYSPVESSNMWQIIPESTSTSVKSVTFYFDELELLDKMKNVTPSNLSHQTCEYHGVPYVTEAIISATVGGESSLSFTETFGFSFESTVTAGVEGIASGSISIGFNNSISNTQSETSSWSTTIASNVTVNVVDKTLYAIIILKKAVIELNFKMKVVFKSDDVYESTGVWKGICIGDVTTVVKDHL